MDYTNRPNPIRRRHGISEFFIYTLVSFDETWIRKSQNQRFGPLEIAFEIESAAPT